MKRTYSYLFDDLFDVDPCFLLNKSDRDLFVVSTVSVIIDEETKSIEWIVRDVLGQENKIMFANTSIDTYDNTMDIVIGKWKKPFLLKLYDRTGNIINTIDFTNPKIFLKNKIKDNYLFEIKYDNKNYR